jgi:hypothetical protein
MSKAIKMNGRRYVLQITIKKFIDDYVYQIDLDADYQREKIWSRKEQELLLDSILNDIDIPKIYLVETPDSKNFNFECIDGKQRMTTLLSFFKPNPNEDPLRVRVAGANYAYKELKTKHLTIAKVIENYELSFSIYKSIDDELVREIFRRLQLGVRLNTGELLRSRTGTIRDFIYKEIGNDGPFFRHTKLSEKRFSRPFTLAQICINSFNRIKTGDFVRARLPDIEEFFEDCHDLNKNDDNLTRIKEVLQVMDKEFGRNAQIISSRAVAVSAYLLIEDLFLNKKNNLISNFVEFFIKLLNEIDHNMELLRNYKKLENTTVMEKFQKYILQASVEPYSIKRRHEFLARAFDHYLKTVTKGKVANNK